MKRARLFIALSLGLALAVACRRKPPPSPPLTAVSAKPAKSAVSFEPAPDEVPAVEGPAPSGASQAEREQAVVALLRGQRPTTRFPIIATEDGGAVDPALREALSPHETIEVPEPTRTPPPSRPPRPIDRGYPLSGI